MSNTLALYLQARTAGTIAPFPFPASMAETPECASMHYDIDAPDEWDKAGEESSAGIALHCFPLAVIICAELWRGECEGDADMYECSRFQAASWCADNPVDATVIQDWAATLPPESLPVYAHLAARYFAAGAVGDSTSALINQIGRLAPDAPTYGADGVENPALLAAQYVAYALTPVAVIAALADWRDTLV